MFIAEIDNKYNKNLKTIFNFLKEFTDVIYKVRNKSIVGDTYTIVKDPGKFIMINFSGKNEKIRLAIEEFIRESDCKKEVSDALLEDFKLQKLKDKQGRIISNRKQAVAIAISIGNKKCKK
jgi:ABC-type lipopolysaccharide export system ATPase subunit